MAKDKTYWYGNGKYQKQLDAMLKAEDDGTYEFTNAYFNMVHSYYRYYNDGDLPGWARGKHELTQYNRWGHMSLNGYGEDELERRADERIAKEWKRFQRLNKGGM